MPDIFFHISAVAAGPAVGPSASSSTATATSSSSSLSSVRSKVLRIIYFIPGNPGLIDYYGPFLRGLVEANGSRVRDGAERELQAGDSGEIDEKEAATVDAITVVAGASLGGFETGSVTQSQSQRKSETGTSEANRRNTGAAIRTADDSQGTYDEEDVRGSDFTGTDDDIRLTGNTDGEYGDQQRYLELYPSPFAQKDVYDLTDQIELTYLRLTSLVERLQRRFLGPGEGGNGVTTINTEVFLLGHSVGAYIALEVVRRRHEDWMTMLTSKADLVPEINLTGGATAVPISSEISESKSNSRSLPSTDLIARDMNSETDRAHSWSIKATMLLTPTIQNIALSPSGRIATPLLSNITFLPVLAQLGASSLARILPISLFRHLVRNVTGMRNENMVDVTVEFLRSPGAVKQALYLASHEMVQIGDNAWTDAIWGAVASDVQVLKQDGKSSNKDQHWVPPIHHFLFAKEDHWIASETREAIIESIGGRAKVLVDDGEMKLVHAWCLEQSKLVVELVDTWIAEIVEDKVQLASI